MHEERIHLFHSQLGMSSLGNQPDMDNVGNCAKQQINSYRDRNSSPTQRMIDTNLKLFKQGQEIFAEEPLERFLTPDGCSDPSFFARPALAKMDMPFGSAEKIDDRKRKARSNAELVRMRKLNTPKD